MQSAPFFMLFICSNSDDVNAVMQGQEINF
ncbi:Uncharacterised protein [Vibrio anguillarum]|nr:Uncharacterised protein [Vibrio anguillarum]